MITYVTKQNFQIFSIWAALERINDAEKKLVSKDQLSLAFPGDFEFKCILDISKQPKFLRSPAGILPTNVKEIYSQSL